MRPQAAPSPAQLDPELRARLALLGQSAWRGAAGEPSPIEIFAQLAGRWGRRATLIDLYQLEALCRGVAVAELPPERRRQLSDHALSLQWPNWSHAGAPRRAPEPVVIVPYDRDWPAAFQRWQERIRGALGKTALRVEHVGSTAVPGLAAKPVIDVQVSVADLERESCYAPQLAAIEVQLASRDQLHRYFCPPPGRPRVVQVHVCRQGGGWEREHLLFRDYLRESPLVRRRYAQVKRQLARRWRDDRLAYTDAKTAFILDTLQEAERWAASRRWAVGPAAG